MQVERQPVITAADGREQIARLTARGRRDRAHHVGKPVCGVHIRSLHNGQQPDGRVLSDAALDARRQRVGWIAVGHRGSVLPSKSPSIETGAPRACDTDGDVGTMT